MTMTLVMEGLHLEVNQDPQELSVRITWIDESSAELIGHFGNRFVSVTK
jgi:hypothetical protein